MSFIKQLYEDVKEDFNRPVVASESFEVSPTPLLGDDAELDEDLEESEREAEPAQIGG